MNVKRFVCCLLASVLLLGVSLISCGNSSRAKAKNEIAQSGEFSDRQFFRAIFCDIVDGGLYAFVRDPLFAIELRQYIADKFVKAARACRRAALVR